MTKIIDLSHTIATGMAVYPGTEPPEFSDWFTIDSTGFVEKKIMMFSHTGTHVDAPSHILKRAKSLDQIPISRFSGKASVLDFSKIQKTVISYQDVICHESLLKKNDFILFYTGWYKKWGQESYFNNFPVLSKEAAKWIAEFPLKGIGMDMISVDRTDTRSFPIHKIFLKKNILIIENLTALEGLVGKDFTFSCFPLKIEDSDGAPARAVALV